MTESSVLYLAARCSDNNKLCLIMQGVEQEEERKNVHQVHEDVQVASNK